jgi:hypothetical protein
VSAVAIAGMAVREQHCKEHGPYTQIYIPRLDVWTGQCGLCAAHKDLERQAREILSKRDTELRRQISERYNPDDQQIKVETDAAIEAAAQRIVDEIETHRPDFEADVRRRHHARAEQEVETEMLAEIVSELRKGNQTC